MYNSILIIKPGAIGDLLHLTPVIRSLKQKYPEARITLLVGATLTASLFRYNSDLHEVVIYDRKGEHKGLRGLISLWRQLRQRRFDLVVNFQRSNLKTWLLATAAFPCRVLVYHKARRRMVHAVINHLETLAPLGIDPTEDWKRLDLPTGPEDEAFAEQLFLDGRLSGKQVVAFNPGTAQEVKCWPIDRFAKLADRVAEELNCAVLILGSKAEKGLADAMREQMKHDPVDLTGCSLRELAAVLKRTEVLVTGDTGPMHIATAVGTPVVALFGPTSPERSGPVGDSNHVIIHEELACCPCNSFSCQHAVYRECMDAITVDEVFAAIGDQLAE